MGRIVNLGKEQTAKIPNGLNYKFVYTDNLNFGSLAEILNIQGSGFLKSAFILGM